MQAGRLDRRVTIERASVTLDAYGGETRSWAPVAEVAAMVVPVSDGERWRAGEVAATVTHRITVRWGHGVLPSDRIVHAGRVFEITGVKEIGRREAQEITAAARAE